jgi:uncharacterized glyoxalase superfamily protein PhnB
MTNLPIACTLDPAELQGRREALLPDLAAQALTCDVLPNGLQWHFAPHRGFLEQVARVIEAERQCCPFLRFDLTTEPNGGPFRLAVTGPAGTREFLDALTGSGGTRAVGIRRVVPDLASRRLESTRAFYQSVLGFQVTMDMPINAGRIVTLVSPDNPTAQISLLSGRPSTSSQEPNLTIEVEDVDAIHANAVVAGAQIVYPLTTEPWGVRRFFVSDPDGVIINIMTHPR